MARSIVVLLFSLSAPLAAAAVELPPPVARKIDFRADVYPLLAAHCFRCHRGPDARSGHRLDVRAEILNKDEPLAVPGNSAASRLVQLVAGRVNGQVMPPPEYPRLTAGQVGLLRAWIDQGLRWDEQLLPPPAPDRHWAFRPVHRPALPAVHNRAWIRTPVDAFVAAGHERRGLTPAPEASRRVLIRRVTLDLTGLPPTPEEVETFVADPAPDAYERLVDRLLASPHYGERWGRHWLDVARYADSEGYENNFLRPDAWRYRDYVVRSFNEDKPFDLFIRQQVAGDEMVPCRDENLIATGFLACARYSSNEEDKAMQRNDVLVDIVNATAAAFLGLTMGCAQCHDHKYDPITQRDYYRFQGFFVRGQLNNLVLRDPALWRRYEAAPKPAAYGPARKLRDTIYNEAEARLREAARRKLSPAARAAMDVPEYRRSRQQWRLADDAEPQLRFTIEEVERAIRPEDRKLYDELKKKLEALEKQLPAKPQTPGFYSPDGPNRVDVLPMQATYPLPYDPDQLRHARPYLLARGDVHRRGKELDVGWPAVFGPTPRRKLDRTPRSALADWLTDPSNPLTARVWANRVWQYHFGRGLVVTSGDFGLQGARPSHPELLDYLASELVRHGWSTKHLHRLIVTSATYRQASRPDPGNGRTDADNVYLWRWSPRRLEAEAIRDEVLAVSGELSLDLGGPGVPLTERNKWLNELPAETERVLRRSLYLEQRRDDFPPVQSLFDGPRANESCARRHVSTVALQPLFLLNSPFMDHRARAFAARVARLAGRDVNRRIDVAFRLALGRSPEEVEQRALWRLFESGSGGPAGGAPALVQVCHLLLNLNEFVYLE